MDLQPRIEIKQVLASPFDDRWNVAPLLQLGGKLEEREGLGTGLGGALPRKAQSGVEPFENPSKVRPISRGLGLFWDLAPGVEKGEITQSSGNHPGRNGMVGRGDGTVPRRGVTAVVTSRAIIKTRVEIETQDPRNTGPEKGIKGRSRGAALGGGTQGDQGVCEDHVA